ncbi:MAG: glycosyl hydrolase [Robiginitomaculum sp.]|nr:MAG: glycosyl hydrolase [Robiginitomaculum sp.]
MFSRRKFLGTGAALGVASCATTGMPYGASKTATNTATNINGLGLNDIAKSRGIRFGTALSAPGGNAKTGAFYDEKYIEIIKAQCGVLVAENEFKMYTIQPVDGPYRFTRPDKLVAFAQANNMGMRGHTLLWNKDKYMSPWVMNNAFEDGVDALLRTYIEAVVGRYKDDVYSWDVVNETIDEHTGARRDTVFTRNGGQEIVDNVFHVAREQAPDTQLVYNDFMSWENHSAAHRKGVLKLLEHFRKNNVPVDALGIQGHIGQFVGDSVTGYKGQYDVKAWQEFLKEATDMGYDLVITEFDVNDTDLVADVAKRDQVIADYAKEYLDVTLEFTQLKDVLAWGISDNHSWLRSPDWWPREDGLLKRSTPYSDSYKPKALRQAMAEAFAAAPVRTPLV